MKAGVPCELVVVEDAVHSFHLQPPQRDLRPAVIAFFDRHLKPRPAATPCPGHTQHPEAP